MNKDSFTSPFPIWMVFLPTSLPLFLFLFSLPYCTSWNLLTRLNRSSEHMSLFCTCSWGKTFSPSPSSMMLAVGIIKLRKFSSTPSQLRVFIRNGCLILSNVFSTSIEMIIRLFIFGLLIWQIKLSFECYLPPPL